MTTAAIRYRRGRANAAVALHGIGASKSSSALPSPSVDRSKRPRRVIPAKRLERALLVAALVNSMLAIVLISRYLPDHTSSRNLSKSPLRNHRQALMVGQRLGAIDQLKVEMPIRPTMLCALPKSRIVISGTIVIVDMNFTSDDELCRDNNQNDNIRPLRYDESEDYYTIENGYYNVGPRGSEDAMCQPPHKWMTTHFPNCNAFHALFDDVAQLSYLTHSTITDVMTKWEEVGYQDANNNDDGDDDRWVLKSNRYWFDLDGIQMEQRRKEAVVMERMTASPYAPSIFGHCGMSMLVPYATSGTLYDFIKSVRKGGPDLTDRSMDTLRISVQLAEGLAALHDIDGDGIPSFSHNDLDPDQFVYNEKRMAYQINDFNLGRWILRNKETGESCKVMHSGMNMFKSRAPEDMAVSYYGSNEPFDLAKSDVFSLGITLYMALTRQWVWEGEDKKVSVQKLIQGQRPSIPEDIIQSGDPAFLAVVEAINACWQHDPEQRPTAKELAQSLLKRLFSLSPQEKLADETFVQVQPPPRLEDIMDMDDDYDDNM